MLKKLNLFFLCVFSLVSSIANNQQVPSKKRIYLFDIKEEIAPAVWRKTKKAFEEAEALKSDVILIRMNTYGGMLETADSIRTKILNSKIPVYVFIDNNAASAGALISIACNKIYMRPGGTIGAASVVNQSGEVMPDKYQSYMRAMMRGTAEKRGRNPEIAQAMVDGKIVVEGVNKEGQVVTFTSKEAIKQGYCEGEAENESEALKLAGIENYSTDELKVSFIDKVVGYLLHPAVNGILILLILGGIYFEFQHPGAVFPIAISILAALLYFAPHYLDGLAANWEILVFFVGLILLAVEIFVIPGFGVAGVSGIILMIVGLVLSMVRNVNFNFEPVGQRATSDALFTVTLALVGFIVSAILLGGRFLNSNWFYRISNQSSLSDSKAIVNIEAIGDLKGQMGLAISDIKPMGNVLLDNGMHIQVSSYGEFLPRGTKVLVVSEAHNKVWVKKID